MTKKNLQRPPKMEQKQEMGHVRHIPHTEIHEASAATSSKGSFTTCSMDPHPSGDINAALWEVVIPLGKPLRSQV